MKRTISPPRGQCGRIVRRGRLKTVCGDSAAGLWQEGTDMEMAAGSKAEAYRIYLEYMKKKEAETASRQTRRPSMNTVLYGNPKPRRRVYKVETFRSGSTYEVDRMISCFYGRMANREGFRVVNVSYEVVVFDTVAHVHYEVME